MSFDCSVNSGPFFFFFSWTMILFFYLALSLNKYHTGVADF